MRKFFLACPYGHPDPKTVEMRFDTCNEVSAKIIVAGHAVFSQVSMSHPINAVFNSWERTDISELWAPVDEMFMSAMDELIVVDIEGWKQSSGVAREIKFFEDRGRPVHYWSEIQGEFEG